MQRMNAVEQLKVWVNNDTIGIKEFSAVYRNMVRRKYADTFGDLLGGKNENFPGLMFHLFQILEQLEGSMMLYHLRCKQSPIAEQSIIERESRAQTKRKKQGPIPSTTGERRRKRR